jgi:hypothetical protein
VNGRKLARLFGVVRHPDCATQPFFAEQKIGIRTVLAETPNSRASLSAPLLFTKGWHRPNLIQREIQQVLS